MFKKVIVPLKKEKKNKMKKIREVVDEEFREDEVLKNFT
jgi:hypothetical protein